MSDKLESLEVVAEQCHKQWSGWTAHLLARVGWEQVDDSDVHGWVDRWQRQINTPYAELSEEEKEADRREARKILAALRNAWQSERVAYDEAKRVNIAYAAMKDCAEKAEVELKDIKDAYAQTIAEACNPPAKDDRVHCTCVPALRARIKDLEGITGDCVCSNGTCAAAKGQLHIVLADLRAAERREAYLKTLLAGKVS